jgi:tripartite-type tricarboxylate transporter receptor subunit TctC
VDVLARVVSQELSARLGQTIIVDNRPGAGTTIGAKAVAAATADGYTLLIAGQSIVYSPMLYPNLGFDPLKSFVPVATLVEWSQLLVVAPSVPVKNVEELVAYAKANPGKLSLGYGIGTTPHIIGEMFKVVTKADINSVPYRGGAQAVTDLLGGRIHMNIGTTATLLPWIRQGKLRALAFSGMKRSSDLPEVPTLLESGFAQLAFEPTWQGVLAPAGTPTAVINKLNAAIRDSFSSPQVEASLSKLGFEKKLTSPQEFAAFLAAEAQRWPPIIRASGVKAE